MDAKAPMRVEEEREPRRLLSQILLHPRQTCPKLTFHTGFLLSPQKFKNYMKVHGLNTSANVMERLSDLVRELADEASQKLKKQKGKKNFDG